MDFIRIAEIFDKIDKENITSRIELTKSVAKFIADISDEDLQIFTKITQKSRVETLFSNIYVCYLFII